MVRTKHVLVSIAFVCAFSQLASAQRGNRGFGFGFFGNSRVALTNLEQVQKELKVDDAQKEKLTDINQELRDARQEMFQNRGSDIDFAAMREKMQKLNKEAEDNIAKALNDNQKKRLTEIFVQVAGTSALNDDSIRKALTISDEQIEQFQEVVRKSGEAMREISRDLSREERNQKINEWRTERDKNMLAVLNNEQRDKFIKMEGEKFELDRSQFRRRGRGGGQRGNQERRRPEVD